jgi:hypothetical protein
VQQAAHGWGEGAAGRRGEQCDHSAWQRLQSRTACTRADLRPDPRPPEEPHSRRPPARTRPPPAAPPRRARAPARPRAPPPRRRPGGRPLCAGSVRSAGGRRRCRGAAPRGRRTWGGGERGRQRGDEGRGASRRTTACSSPRPLLRRMATMGGGRRRARAQLAPWTRCRRRSHLRGQLELAGLEVAVAQQAQRRAGLGLVLAGGRAAALAGAGVRAQQRRRRRSPAAGRLARRGRAGWGGRSSWRHARCPLPSPRARAAPPAVAAARRRRPQRRRPGCSRTPSR